MLLMSSNDLDSIVIYQQIFFMCNIRIATKHNTASLTNILFLWATFPLTVNKKQFEFSQ